VPDDIERILGAQADGRNQGQREIYENLHTE
jgi:hypothetical protein